MNRGKRILVVDDDLGILESFDALFGDEFEMVSAQSGYQAMEKLSETSFQLVFLDIKMPGMNGIEVLRRIRSQAMEPRVVIITAVDQEDCEEEARNLGIDAYIRKPFDVGEVLSIVDTA